MTRDRLLAFGVYGLGVWSLFVWGTRIRNALGDDALDTAAKDLAIGTSVVMIVLTMAAVVARARVSIGAGPNHVLEVMSRGGAAPSPHRARADNSALLASVVSIAVWLYRVPAIWLAEHTTGFKVVHTMLAVVTWGFALLVVARVREGRIVHPDIPSGPIAGVSPAGVTRR